MLKMPGAIAVFRTQAVAFLITLLAVSSSSAQGAYYDDAWSRSSFYDDTWFRSEMWGHEYPTGFAILKDLTVLIRDRIDPTAPKTVACNLPKNAVFHPWNYERMGISALSFVTYFKTETFIVNEAFKAKVRKSDHDDFKEVEFKKGDTWAAVFYDGEGWFEMRFNGFVYMAGQDMFTHSSDRSDVTDVQVHEWMHLTCANGATGWILAQEVIGMDGIVTYSPTGYGHAADIGKESEDP